jgi:hypothetical protein
MDEKFEAIGEEAAQAATKVKCSLQEYCDGLKIIQGRIADALAAGEEDLAAQEEEALAESEED